jgi:hypothetical protein
MLTLVVSSTGINLDLELECRKWYQFVLFFWGLGWFETKANRVYDVSEECLDLMVFVLRISASRISMNS